MDAAHDQVETAAARRRRSVVGSRVLIIATIAVVGMSGCAGAETAATPPSPAASAASMAPASAAPRVSAAPATPSPTTGEPELDALVDVGAGRQDSPSAAPARGLPRSSWRAATRTPSPRTGMPFRH